MARVATYFDSSWEAPQMNTVSRPAFAYEQSRPSSFEAAPVLVTHPWVELAPGNVWLLHRMSPAA